MKRLSFLRGALAIAAALLALGTSCTNDDNGIGNPQVATPQAMGRIHVTVGAGMGGEADTQTRSDVIVNTDEDTRRTLIFTEGDKLFVTAVVTADNAYIVAGTLSIGDISDEGKTAMFSGDLQVYHFENGAYVESTYDFTDAADPLDKCKNHAAWLIAKDMPADAYTIEDYWYFKFDYSKSIAADVETLMKTALNVKSYRSYKTENVDDGGPKMFRNFGGEPILSCAVSGLTAGTAYTVTLLADDSKSDWDNYAGNRYSVTYATPVTAGDDGKATFAISFDSSPAGGSYWWTLKLVGGGITRYVKLGQRTMGTNKVYRVNREATYASKARILNDVTADLTLANGDMLTGTLDVEKYKVKISIADGATVTLDGATIIGKHYGDTECQWAGLTCVGDATIILADGTENSVTNFQRFYPCIHVPEGYTLTIRGGSAGTGKLIANAHNFGAGIGGGSEISCGNIEIEGGTVRAQGGNNAAGIGCGYGASCGTIKISGGTVNATGGYSGAGIGCGLNASCGAITITGGTVNATGAGASAGIGSGSQASCGDITISGGTVNATGGGYGAGIGSGYYNASCGDITISGGTVRAQGGNDAAGIGCGFNASCGNITISNGTGFVSVTAIKGGGAKYPIGLFSHEKNTCGEIDFGGMTIKYSNSKNYSLNLLNVGSLHVDETSTIPDGTPEVEQGQYEKNTWVLTPK